MDKAEKLLVIINDPFGPYCGCVCTMLSAIRCDPDSRLAERDFDYGAVACAVSKMLGLKGNLPVVFERHAVNWPSYVGCGSVEMATMPTPPGLVDRLGPTLELVIERRKVRIPCVANHETAIA